MPPLPARDLRSNLATWAVAPALAPAVAGILLDTFPREAFDPGFFGQVINTHYFDTADFDLRTAQLKKSKCLTLRVRCYKAQGQVEGYALSAKTEDQKFRVEIDADTADFLTTTPNPPLPLSQLLPGELFGRLLGSVPFHGSVTRPAVVDGVSLQIKELRRWGRGVYL